MPYIDRAGESADIAAGCDASIGDVVPDEANVALQLLKDRLATICDVRGIESLLLWDQQTYMPAGGVAGRAEQLATLRLLGHESLVSGETGRLLGSVSQPEPESADFSLLRLEIGRASCRERV